MGPFQGLFFILWRGQVIPYCWQLHGDRRVVDAWG